MIPTTMRLFLLVAVLWEPSAAFHSLGGVGYPLLSPSTRTASTSTSLTMVLDRLFPSLQSKSDQQTIQSNENGRDPEYPWCFTGRLWFRPALVRVQDSNTQALEDSGIISVLNLFGYTVGGTVALEYDTSPVGPYREYVSMGALVACAKGGMIGQWGSRLYVSTKTAEEICQQVWAVPAEVADIQFAENSQSLKVECAPDPLDLSTNTKKKIEVTGWSNTRVSDPDAPVRGGLPILWTPTIKALWVKLLPRFLAPLAQETELGGLNSVPVHKLRLSASSLRLQFCGQEPSDVLGIPLGIGLSVDNVLIEIGREEGVL
ncbi:expressed unknown protein [Seminavis robusta]|uniref:Uncharacterized protein n=1 Tax=Seminavis robusta TaxID=568900 RepID=A0A9N8HCG3_9STRA|nr:expressed unknown protein [Seminavis robusta]|eukprot:Sro217_g089590.1 n/a (317) ;mRNA; f:4721-5671